MLKVKHTHTRTYAEGRRQIHKMRKENKKVKVEFFQRNWRAKHRITRKIIIIKYKQKSKATKTMTATTTTAAEAEAAAATSTKQITCGKRVRVRRWDKDISVGNVGVGGETQREWGDCERWVRHRQWERQRGNSAPDKQTQQPPSSSTEHKAWRKKL